MSRTYTFNRPLALLFLTPLILLVVVMVFGIFREFSAMVLVVLLISALLAASILWYSFFRRLRIEDDKAVWLVPGKRLEIGLEEIRHFGIVKYRSFRFIYLSKAEEDPFAPADSRIVPDETTFVVQYRKSAWELAEKWIQSAHSDLKPHQHRRQ